MNTEWKEKWISALRSGNYRQIRGSLRGRGGFCCLGVLCDLTKEVLDTNWTPRNSFLGSYSLLPKGVIKLVGLNYADPMISKNGKPMTLAQINDFGMSFKDIANIIEEQL